MQRLFALKPCKLLHSIGRKIHWQRKISVNAAANIPELAVGTKIHGFTVKTVEDVPELCLTAVRLSHEATGADYLHIAREDGDNLFGVGFRTPALESTGVPHILEHTTLCGSEKYPCRDPFFKMLNRSMSTFMNAFTGNDFTVYPFSTQNTKDFENLLRVYLDATFFPRLRHLDFLQEGWRLEHENVADKSSPIIIKGVVFNEMKGAFADSERVFCQAMQNLLLPSHTYSYVSGGDPLCIPDLTWEHLKKFHSVHYHPSNSRFFSYGNFPLQRHLEVIEQVVLSKFKKTQPDTVVPVEPRWTSPRRAHITCCPDPMAPNPEKQTMVSVTYLLGSNTDVLECCTQQLLSELLVQGPNSPFYKALIEPNIGSGYSPMTGFSQDMKDTLFSVGLKGVSNKDVQKVLNIISETFDEVIRDGIPAERVDAVLHNVELSMKHQKAHFGLHTLLALLPSWNHDGDPVLPLKVNSQIIHFRKNYLEDHYYLQNKVKEYFKDNTHNLSLTMSPDKDYEVQRQQKEQEILATKLKGLTDLDKSNIYQLGIELEKNQNEEENVSCLPTLKLSDVDKKIHRTELETVNLGGVEMQCSPQQTNGVVYFRAAVNLKKLGSENKSLLPLLCFALTRMGAGEKNHVQLSHEIDMKTGGLNASVFVSENPFNCNEYEEGIVLSSYCLERNLDDMLGLWNEIFSGVNLRDKSRLTTLITTLASDMAAGLSDSGHLYAMSRAASTLTSSAAMKECYSGMESVVQLKRLASNLGNVGTVANHLQEMGEDILRNASLRIAVNALPKSMSRAQASVGRFVNSVSSNSCVATKKFQGGDYCAVSSRSHHVLPFPCYYNSKCLPAVSYAHQDFAALKILSRLLSAKYLHREIREKGGAYGGGAKVSRSGIFSYYSYRDPKCGDTFHTFDKASEWAIGGNYSQADLDEAKLSVFSEMDSPEAPGNKGNDQFLNGITDDMKQRYRDNLFATTKDDLVTVSKRYLLEDMRKGMAILGPQVQLTEDGSWTLIRENV